ncbi:uroporphyrinogen-III C-methyltransferase [Massilia agilis]|uniref:Uroporphyrinogen-III C-methyltransferase n=1 Tax=Massilia agilis TaxID=1811226 RepID=A0ABT2DAA6_9BURK|nr:uroporphyrinogen-III C-methyltransferase [Massilia agilis]MCS0808225.1 uroporphyrinogen-III C-methyltransferase [Massilia agilis]
MNELPNLPEQGAQPAPGQGAPQVPPAAPRSGLFETLRQPLPAAVSVLAVLLVAHMWSTHSRINSMRADVARMLQKDEQVAAETSALAREVSEQSKQLQVKVGVLESRQQEAQSQQAALEQLYQDLSKNRDEWALSEIEQVLSTASQQLQLAGNVQGALIALSNADRSLSRSDKPQFITIRRAIAHDMEKLKALPAVDLAGVALRLDNVIAEVDSLPLLSDEKPLLPAPPAPRAKARKNAPAPAPAQPLTLGQRMTDTWRAWSTEMWDDIRQLVRVRSVETPEALMLSPTESYFVRENLKLRLLNARLALLSRNESAFRDDLNTAQTMLLKYFDTRARSTQAAQSALRQVQANNLTIEMPTLADSLNAVRNYKAK